MTFERWILSLSAFFLALALGMASCDTAGYQFVPSISAAYDPQREDYFGTVGVTYAPPMRMSDVDREIFRGSWSDGAAGRGSADLARLQAENTALEVEKARAAEHSLHPAEDGGESVVDVLKEVGQTDWTWPMVWGVVALSILVVALGWTWTRLRRRRDG